MHFKRMASLFLILTILASMLPPTAACATDTGIAEETFSMIPESMESIPAASTAEETSTPTEELPSANFSVKPAAEPDDGAVASGNVNETVQWALLEDGTLQVWGTGTIDSAPWSDYWAQVQYVDIGSNITLIGQNIFSSCANNLTIRFDGTKLQWLKVCCSDLEAICIDGTSESVRAYGICDTEDVHWVLTDKNILYIFGEGEMDKGIESWSEDAVPWCYYRNFIDKVVIDEGITDIGGYAFYQCPNLNEITIPSTVSRIHSYAFLSVEYLNKVYINDLVQWCTIDYGEPWNSSPTESGADLYLNGTLVTDLEIPNGITSINQSFRNCKSLTSVMVPEGVTEIKEKAFYWCSSLASVSLPSTLTSIGAFTFYGCNLKSLSLPEGLLSIGEAAFCSNYDLPEITIPRSIEVISSDAFRDCDNLKTITFRHGSSDNLLIGENAFFIWRNRNTSIKVPVTSQIHEAISSYDWAGSNRSTIFSPHNCMNNHYRDIDGSAPATCTQTGSTGRIYCGACGITFSAANTLPALGHDEVIDAGYAATCTSTGLTDGRHCQRCGTTLVSQQTTPVLEHSYDAESVCIVCGTIGVLGSGNCGTNLTWELCSNGKLTISGSGHIPEYTSSYTAPWYDTREEIRTVIMDSGITRIGDYAFYDCNALTDVQIPDNIIAIGAGAFASCDTLTTMILGNCLRSMGSSVFQDCTNLQWICFRGDAPAFDDNTFHKTNTTAYYPGGNSSWTKELLKHYGGKLSWKPYTTNVEIFDSDGSIINGSTVWANLNSNVTALTFRADIPMFEDYEKCPYTWSWTNGPGSAVENENGSITVIPTGTPGEMTLTATAANGSNAAVSFKIKFVRLAVNKEDIPGENAADLNLLSGKTKQLSILNVDNVDTGKPLTAKEVTWSMDEVYAPYAKIDAKGKLTAKKVVEKVRVEAIGSIIGSESTTVTVTVDIFPAVSGVEIKRGAEAVNNKTLDIDSAAEPLVLTANIHPSDAMDGVEWNISDSKKEAFASYAIAGNKLTITPKAGAKAGTVTVKATSTDGSKKSATVKLNFGVLATGVTIGVQDKKNILPAEEWELVSGKSVQLAATVVSGNGKPTNSKVVWSTDNPCVKISASGRVTAQTVYENTTAVITATTADGSNKQDTFTVTVLPKDPGIIILRQGAVNVTKSTLYVDTSNGGTVALTAHNLNGPKAPDVIWKSGSPKIATVENGVVTFLKSGSTVITATDAGNSKRSATVTIKGSVLTSKVTITEPEGGQEVASGMSLTLKAVCENAPKGTVTWSMEPGVDFAKITASGKLTAAKDITTAKTVTVYATAKDGSGKTDEAEVTIRPLAQGVQVYSEAGGQMLFSFRTQNWWVRSNTTVNWDLTTQADTIVLSAVVYPYYVADNEKNAIQDVTWKSSAPRVADVVNGKLEIYKTGSTTITATAADGSRQQVSFKLNVIRTVEKLIVTPQTVKSGGSLNLAKCVTIDPSDATNKKLNWEIVEGNKLATLSGTILKPKKGVTSGTVKIKVASQDGGASATFTVTINP